MSIDSAASALSEYHGGNILSLEDAERVLLALGVTDSNDLAYVAKHPERVASFDLDTTVDKLAGATGWVIWWEQNDCATQVRNADAETSEEGPIRCLDQAIAWATWGDAGPRELQRRIADDPDASSRVLNWLDSHQVRHSGNISGAALGAVCGVDSRTWRKWTNGERGMPVSAWRLLVEVSGVL